MRVIGRGGATGNTVAAAVRALAAGADGVAVDVRRTADGELVCCRDAAPDAAGGAAEPVVALTWAELARVRLRGGEPVARVADVLDAARGRGTVVLDVRNVPGEPDFDAPDEATARLLAGLLRDRRGRDRVVVSSYDWFAVEVVRDAGVGVPTGFRAPPGVAAPAALAYAVGAGHRECHPHAGDVLAEPGVVAAARAAGVAVVCWGVEDAGQARELAGLGVHGVVTGDAAALRARLALPTAR